MPDEIKSPSTPPPEGEPKPTADQPATPGGVKATPSGSVQSETKTTPTKPSPPSEASTPATPPKAAAAAPATPAAKPAAAPPKAPVPTPVPWDSPMIAKLKREYGSGISPLTYLGQNYMEVDRSLIPNLLRRMRDEEQFDYCVDITAVHYPKREKQFDVIWVLYSFARNERLRKDYGILQQDNEWVQINLGIESGQ
jgi:hypothetical protein